MPRKNQLRVLELFCMALFLITFVSQSSPLYPLNTWDDANCLLTVGRAMRAGTVLYKEIYEQKGPMLYLIHALAAFISDRSFFGVYLFEIAACFLTLLAAYRVCARKGHTPIMPVAFFGAITYASFSFSRGDSAEEFCLPCLMALLMLADDPATVSGDTVSFWRLFLMGLLSGIIGTIKFTILGVSIGICLYIAFRLLPRHPIKLIKAAGSFLVGMLIPVIAWLCYFASKDALQDFYTAYIHNNIFLYAGDHGTLRDSLSMILGNWIWLFLLIPAVAGAVSERNMAILFPLLVQGAVLILGGRMWFYTLLVLTPFAVFGLRSLLPLSGNLLRPKWVQAAASLIALLLAAWFTPNASMRFVPVRDTAQGRLCAEMEQGASFLQYSHLDDGLYLLLDTLPQEKFFVSLNVEYPKMHEELNRYLDEGIPQYVLITWRMLPERFDKYSQIDYANSYDVFTKTTKDFFLYERVDQ